MAGQQVINQLNLLLPEILKKEVLDSIGYLMNKYSIDKEVKNPIW